MSPTPSGPATLSPPPWCIIISAARPFQPSTRPRTSWAPGSPRNRVALRREIRKFWKASATPPDTDPKYERRKLRSLRALRLSPYSLCYCSGLFFPPLAGRQISVHERDRHRTFSHRRRATFHRPVSHIAGRKHPRHIRFQIIGRPIERPPPIFPPTPRQIRSGHQMPVRIADDSYFCRPFRSRRAADAGEKPLGRNLLRAFGPLVANLNALQRAPAGKTGDARVGHHR